MLLSWLVSAPVKLVHGNGALNVLLDVTFICQCCKRLEANDLAVCNIFYV